jgi:hypothetical protein
MTRPNQMLTRLHALERKRGILPTDLKEWTDEQIREAAEEWPLSAMFKLLSDEEVQAVVVAPPTRSLHDILTARPAPWEWPEWSSWDEETQNAVRQAWGME